LVFGLRRWTMSKLLATNKSNNRVELPTHHILLFKTTATLCRHIKGQPTSNRLEQYMKLKFISVVYQSLHSQNHNLCIYKFQVLYSIDRPSCFWETVLSSHTMYCHIS
jgi:hypothetical protein